MNLSKVQSLFSASPSSDLRQQAKWNRLTPKQYGLQLALKDYKNGSDEAWHWLLCHHQEKLTLNDFKARAFQSPEINGMSLAYEAYQNERISPYHFLKAKFAGKYTERDFTAKPPKSTEYYVNTRKINFIWISAKKNIAIPTENKVRLIRTRVANPEAQLSLVYSSKVLSKDAIEDLTDFTKRLAIRLIDFDSDIQSSIKSDDDRELYEIAKSEIEHTVRNSGGNLGAASDCIRLLDPVMEEGLYSDLDVHLSLASFPKVLRVSSPLVLHTYTNENKDSIGHNNNFFAVPFNSPSLSERSDETTKILSLIKKEVIKNYKNLGSSVFEEITPQAQLDISSFLKTNKKADIFQLRLYLMNIRSSAYTPSVTGMAGPLLITRVLNTYIENAICNPSEINMSNIDAITKLFVQQALAYSLSENGLCDFIKCLTGLKVNPAKEMHNPGDASWLPRYAANLCERSLVIDKAVVKIQSTFRGHRQRQQYLLEKVLDEFTLEQAFEAFSLKEKASL